MFKRISRNKEYNNSKYVCESTDAKPTDDIEYGDFALEIDTGDVYTFDGSTWNAQVNVKFVV